VPTTIRVDGFENVDLYACNAREINAPSSCWLEEKNTIYQHEECFYKIGYYTYMLGGITCLFGAKKLSTIQSWEDRLDKSRI
jgi:hypothetical protein